jgi:AcrR family transcriptional regulator
LTTQTQIINELANLNQQDVWKGFSSKDKLFIAMMSVIAGNTGSSTGGITQAQVQAAIESATNLDQLETLLGNLGTYVDGLEALNTTLNTYVDGVEGLETAIRDRLTAVSFATDALQTAGNTTLTAINTKLPVQGQAVAAASVPVVLPATQITALTPPANTGYALDATVNSLLKPSSTLTAIDSINNPLPAGTNILGKVGIDSANNTVTVASIATLATAANQASGNANLASIDTKLTTPNIRALTASDVVTVVLPASAATTTLQTTGNTSLTSIDSKLTTPNIRALTSADVVTVVLPATAATAANQATGNTSLASIDSKTNDGLDLQLTGAPTAAANNNILLPALGSSGLDTKLTNKSYRSITVQITPTAATNAVVFFEGSNDNTNWRPIQMVESEYAWTGLQYQSCTFNNSLQRTFEGAIKHRYIRFRLNATASVSLITTTILSPNQFTYPDRSFPSANFILSAELTASAGGTYVAAPTAPLQIYFCGASVNAGAAAQAEDWWIGVNLPIGRKLGSFASVTSSPESGNIYPPTPIPCGVGNALSGYQNNGAGNIWSSAFYFIAP